MRPLLLLLVSWLAACSSGGRTVQSSPSVTDAARLQDIRAAYLDELVIRQDKAGFISADRCDSLLHTALLVAGGVRVDLTAARNASGQWFRRPVSLYAECLEAGASRSTISRDMLIGVMWAAWITRDLAMAESLWKYGSDRSWKMGESDGSLDGMSRVYLTPNLQGLLARVIWKLGGTSHDIRHLPPVIAGDLDGFQAHLEILHLLLEQDMAGSLPDSTYHILEVYASRTTRNPLLTYAVGDYPSTIRILLEDHPIPSAEDRLCDGMEYETIWNPDVTAEKECRQPGIHLVFLSNLLDIHSRLK